MTAQYLLGIDAGSGCGRCLLFDAANSQAAPLVQTTLPWAHRRAPGGASWSYEIDLEACWQRIAAATRQVLHTAGAGPGAVLGLAVTSMRHTLVLVDRQGQPLLGLPNRDARASGEASELGARQGEALYKRSGHWPIPILLAARLRWLADNAPGLLAAAAGVLSLNDWLAHRLCGQMATDFSQAGESLLLDLTAASWSADLLAELGLLPGLLPPIHAAGARLGGLTPPAAAELGLLAGTPVAVGGADTQCALLAAGALAPGQAAAVTGTTAPIQVVLAEPLLDPDRRVWTGRHLLPGRWVLESNAGMMGDALTWLAGAFYPDAAQPVARLLAEAAAAPPGAGGLLSTFGAEVMDAGQMGLPLGHLTLTPLAGGAQQRANLSRAVLEGMAFAIKANLGQLTRLSEPVAGPLTGLHLTGGMARSRWWAQMVSDVLGLPVITPPTPEASALGAALCAGVAAGVFPNLEESAHCVAGNGASSGASSAAASRARRCTPDPEQSAAYAGLYPGWDRLRQAQAPAGEQAADLILQSVLANDEAAVQSQGPAFSPRVLVTAQFDDASLDELRSLGPVEYANYREVMRLLTGDELVAALQGVQVFITEVDMVDLEALQQLPDLRVVVACRSNAVNVDLAACTALGIPVLNAPGRNATAVAELTLGYLLMLGRKLAPANSFLRQPGGEAGDMGRMGHAYNELVGSELWGKTIGLIGLGAVGRGVARRLQPFGVRLLVYDPFVPAEECALLDAEPANLDELLAASDYVSLHAAVTEQTRGLIGATQLARMKPSAFLINTARAALVDEEALLAALQTGRLAGAALDVFAVEPPAADHPLLALPNVIATPHVAGNTLEVAAHQGALIVADLRRLLAGQAPRNLLNPETLPGFRWAGPRQSLDPAGLQVLAARPGPAVSDLQQAAAPPAAPAATPATAPAALPEAPKEEPQMNTPAAPAPAVKMEKILALFVERAASDPALVSFAAKRDVCSHYTMSDLGLEFYLDFKDGHVAGGLGGPPRPAEVRMKASAETLDGILTGRINGNRAAMSGKLSFSGDVRVAMGLQKIQPDMIRLYSAAREALGGPGDLSAAPAPRPAAPIPAAQPAAPSPAGAHPASAYAAPPAGLSPDDPRLELVQTILELYQAQLVTATGGNLSLRCEGAAEAWITPSQLFKGNLHPEMMVRIDLEGNALDPDSLAPSSERLLHTEIYKARPEVQAIIHAHAPYATILGLSGAPFLPITTEAAFLKDLPRVPFIMPGTRELALAAVKAMGSNPAVLLQNHGLVVVASSMRRAANLLEVVERTSQLILGCLAVGKKPPVLPKNVVKTLREVGEMMA